MALNCTVALALVVFWLGLLYWVVSLGVWLLLAYDDGWRLVLLGWLLCPLAGGVVGIVCSPPTGLTGETSGYGALALLGCAVFFGVCATVMAAGAGIWWRSLRDSVSKKWLWFGRSGVVLGMVGIIAMIGAMAA